LAKRDFHEIANLDGGNIRTAEDARIRAVDIMVSKCLVRFCMEYLWRNRSDRKFLLERTTEWFASPHADSFQESIRLDQHASREDKNIQIRETGADVLVRYKDTDNCFGIKKDQRNERGVSNLAMGSFSKFVLFVFQSRKKLGLISRTEVNLGMLADE
jgi:hypothetical protein